MNVRLRERLPNFQGKDWLERLLLAYLVVAPTTAVCLGANGAAAILGSVGAAALLLTRLPDISSLSLFGLRAELKRSVEQVQVTIHQLQAMATAFAEATLSQLALSVYRTRFLGHKTRLSGDPEIGLVPGGSGC